MFEGKKLLYYARLAAGHAYYGEYPLAFAACRGLVDIYDLLLEHGARPDCQDTLGNTVTHLAVIHDQPVSQEMHFYFLTLDTQI